VTTNVVRGTTVTLVVEWFEFPGGPAVNVTGVGITVEEVDGSPVIVGPTTVGVANPATGINTYPWDTSPSLPVGDYLAVWNGTDPDGEPVQASELLHVLTTETDVGTGPCAPWDPIFTCVELSAAAATVTGTMLEVATEVLDARSGRRFGFCTVTLRPCRKSCSGDIWPPGIGTTWWEWSYGGGGGPRPYWWAGAWFNATCGVCSDSCSCTALSQVLLPAPVNQIIEVKIDGVSVPASGWSLQNSRLLVRTGGNEWPACNDLTKLDTEVGTWSVTASYGEEVPQLGRLAVGELTAELAKACVGEECVLPRNVTTLTRQGVTMELRNLADALAGLSLGYFSDLFIDTVNPHRRERRGQVYDVEQMFHRRVNT